MILTGQTGYTGGRAISISITNTASLIERYARAMILGARRSGFDDAIICKALREPMAGPEMMREAPTSSEQINGFRSHLSAQPAGRIVELDSLDFTPELFAIVQRNLKWLIGDEFYGLTEQPCKPGVFVLMVELILGSSTLESSLRRGIRFFSAVSDDLTFSLDRGTHFAELGVHVKRPELDTLHFLGEWHLQIWHALICWLIGEKIPIMDAGFAHDPMSPISEYSRVFSSSCRFGQSANTIRFNAGFLDRHCVRSMEDFNIFLSANRVDLVSVPGMDNPLAPRILNQMEKHFDQTRELLPMEAVAEEYHVSSQTLRRRLEEEGTSFRALKEEVRKKMILRWLEDVDIPISEVARMAGFAEPSGLSRVVKAWLGRSPTDFRVEIARRNNLDEDN